MSETTKEASSERLSANVDPRYPTLNRSGRAKGTPNKATATARRLLYESSKEIIESVIKSAIAGEPTAQRLCVERLIPTWADEQRLQHGQLSAEEIGNFLAEIFSALKDAQLRREQIALVRSRIIRLPVARNVLEESDEQ